MALGIIGLIYRHFSNMIISRFWWDLGVIMSKDTYSQLIVRSNEYFLAASFLYFHGDKIEDSEKQDIVTNI